MQRCTKIVTNVLMIQMKTLVLISKENAFLCLQETEISKPKLTLVVHQNMLEYKIIHGRTAFFAIKKIARIHYTSKEISFSIVRLVLLSNCFLLFALAERCHNYCGLKQEKRWTGIETMVCNRQLETVNSLEKYSMLTSFVSIHVCK